MRKMGATLLKAHLQRGQTIMIEMAWSMTVPDERVEWSLWTSAVDAPSEVGVECGQGAFFPRGPFLSNLSRFLTKRAPHETILFVFVQDTLFIYTLALVELNPHIFVSRGGSRLTKRVFVSCVCSLFRFETAEIRRSVHLLDHDLGGEKTLNGKTAPMVSCESVGIKFAVRPESQEVI